MDAPSLLWLCSPPRSWPSTPLARANARYQEFRGMESTRAKQLPAELAQFLTRAPPRRIHTGHAIVDGMPARGFFAAIAALQGYFGRRAVLILNSRTTRPARDAEVVLGRILPRVLELSLRPPSSFIMAGSARLGSQCVGSVRCLHAVAAWTQPTTQTVPARPGACAPEHFYVLPALHSGPRCCRHATCLKVPNYHTRGKKCGGGQGDG